MFAALGRYRAEHEFPCNCIPAGTRPQEESRVLSRCDDVSVRRNTRSAKSNASIKSTAGHYQCLAMAQAD